MSKPHKHAALIHAWADGSEIEYRAPGSSLWLSMPTLHWGLIGDYRIKPITKLDVAIEALDAIYRTSVEKDVMGRAKDALNKIRSMES